jgi:hypothetical protein
VEVLNFIAGLWVEQSYVFLLTQVVGSSVKRNMIRFNGKPVLIKLPEINFVDDKEGKPVGSISLLASAVFTAVIRCRLSHAAYTAQVVGPPFRP